MTNPLVSIIIPSYNYAHLIEETLVSVANQEYSNWECIIIDDGSTDNTEAVVNNFISEYPEYKFFYYRFQNAGTSAAKNAGLNLATGELIQFLDADDLLSPAKLSIQVAIMQAHQPALVFSSARFFEFKNQDAQPRLLEKYPQGFLASQSLAGGDLLQRLIQNNVVVISSPLVKKSLIVKAGQFDPGLRNNEDWLLWFKVAILQPDFIYDHAAESFVSIRIHSNSAMNLHRNMFLGEQIVRNEFATLLEKHYHSNAYGVLIKKNNDLLALHQIRSLSVIKGLRYIFSSFTRQPLQNYPLLAKAAYKLFVRVYKNIINNEG